MSMLGHHLHVPGLRWLGLSEGVDVYEVLGTGRILRFHPSPEGRYARVGLRRGAFVYPGGIRAVVHSHGRFVEIFHPDRPDVRFGVSEESGASNASTVVAGVAVGSLLIWLWSRRDV